MVITAADRRDGAAAENVAAVAATQSAAAARAARSVSHQGRVWHRERGQSGANSSECIDGVLRRLSISPADLLLFLLFACQYLLGPDLKRHKLTEAEQLVLLSPLKLPDLTREVLSLEEPADGERHSEADEEEEKSQAAHPAHAAAAAGGPAAMDTDDSFSDID